MEPTLDNCPAPLARRDWLLAAVLALTAAAITADAWADIVRLGFAREELSYVFLAPFVIAFVAWQRAGRLRGSVVRGGWAGLVVMAVGWAAFWYGYLADPVVWRGGAVLLTTGTVVAVVGLDAVWRLWPAFVAVLFLVPVSPDGRYQIALPLQTATAAATQSVCDLLGLDVVRSGNLLSTNGVDVTVAEACNGMRMVFTLLLVCYAAAVTGTSRWWLSLPLVLVSPLLAVLANVVRLVPTVWVFGHAARPTAEAFHAAAGWVMLAFAFGVLTGVLRIAEWLLDTTEVAVPITANPRPQCGLTLEGT